jgi:hypothetical protein
MTDERLIKAAQALRELGIEADAPDQSGNIPGFQDRLVLNIRGICIDEFSDWVSIELRHLDPNSEWYGWQEPPDRADSQGNYPADHSND